MRIVIDMQGAQTASRFRGIGRYTMAFAQAVIRNRGEHEVVLALNGLFPDTIESIRAAFEGLLPQESIRVWHAPGPVSEVNVNNCGRHDIAKLLRSRFFTSLQPDIIHIPSLFEGYVDDAVTSVGGFDRKTLVSVTMHDLIPLLNPAQYLAPSPGYKKYYLHQVDSLKEVNIFLAVSESSRRELVDSLRFDSDSIINASEGVDSDFRVIAGGDAFSSLRVKFELNLPFVLYTGGTDERKNLPRLIEAWSFLPSVLRQQHQLVFAGKMPQNAVGQLTGLASRHGLRGDELRFTGYVDDEELIQLYNLCELFVFPSWHEGFGLPALEAMACGAPVIGANTSSLPEVIGLESALFDPFDVMQMRDKIVQALTDDAFRASLRSHGKEQCKRFSWDSTAQRAIQAWEGAVAAAGTEVTAGAMARRRPRLIEAIAPALGSASPEQLALLAVHIARNERAGIERQLLVDISELCQCDAATGAQRVVRSYLRQLLQYPPAGFRVEPVYATRSGGYRYARLFVSRFLGYEEDGEEDRPIQWQRGDIFFGLDMQHHVQLTHAKTYRQLRQDGVVVKFLVYDLLPIQLADSFKDDKAKALYEQWLRMIVAQDAAICISSATTEALTQWMSANAETVAPGFGIDRLQLYQSDSDPPSNTMRWLSWRQSCEQLKTKLVDRHYRRRQLLVDISELVQRDVNTGIQRVVRSVLLEWLRRPPQHYRVEPVYARVNGPYRYARQFIQRFLNLSDHGDAEDALVEYSPGDRFFGLDLQPQVALAHAATYRAMRAGGVHVSFLVHDLLPMRTPQYFGPGAGEDFERWLNVVAESDGAICVSRTVAEDLGLWMFDTRPDRAVRFKIDWSHNGADIANSGSSSGLPPGASEVLDWLRQRVSFLMVGTLEPRKGHQQVLDAFELLWDSGIDVNLVVVGKVGWMSEKLMARMRNHPERDKRFFWLNGVSDEYLELAYSACNCLIAASYGEGFGLPLIESAQHRLPVMARDIPVFREVAGPHAYYFSATEPEQLAQAVRDWLNLYQREQHPTSEKMPWLTWQQSAQVLLQKIMGVN